jgi:hypothetical protein
MQELRDAHCGSFAVNALVEFELLSLRLKTMSVNYTKCNILIYNYFSVELYNNFILFTQYYIETDFFKNRFWPEGQKGVGPILYWRYKFFLYQYVTHRCRIFGPATLGE